jgi:predicted ATPase/DNA-binding CsgD family transcriptional regulator
VPSTTMLSSAALKIDAMHNLPLQLTSFVGRERELRDLEQLLVDQRLVTVTGTAGSGKTRLALQVAEACETRYHDGVSWVELAPVADPDRVGRAVAGSLGITEVPRQPLLVTLQRRLEGRKMLLVLDNCEHVLAVCAGLVLELLASCQGLTVLTTSRWPLGVYGEAVWQLSPLITPGVLASPEAALATESVRLFVDRARLTRPGYQALVTNASVVAEVCRRLDGLPLAIELAAAKLGAMNESEVLAGLEHRFQFLKAERTGLPPRQTELQAALDWSYLLLTDSEQSLLVRLGVFAGAVGVDSITSVCGAGSDRATQEQLAALVEKSLVTAETSGDRTLYRMLDSVRAFARDRLEERGESEEVSRRHHGHYLQRAREITGGWFDLSRHALTYPSPAPIQSELNDFRLALDWAMSRPAESGLELPLAMSQFWYMYGPLGEARETLERAVATNGTGFERAASLGLLAMVAASQGDIEPALTAIDESLALCEQLGDDVALVGARATRAFLTLAKDAPRAAELAGDLAPFPALPSTLAFWVRFVAGVVAAEAGKPEEARHLIEEALTFVREDMNTDGEVVGLEALARLELESGRPAAARQLSIAALRIRWALGHRQGMADSFESVASIEAREGVHSRALVLLGAADAVRAVTGSVPWPASARLRTALEADSLAALGAEAGMALLDAGRKLSIKEAVTFAVKEGELDRPPGLLSRREREVAGLVADGLSNREIATKLFLSERTAESHLERIRHKLGLHNRAQLATWVAEQGWRRER